jgi:hypothetical protein
MMFRICIVLWIAAIVGSIMQGHPDVAFATGCWGFTGFIWGLNKEGRG